MKTFLIISLIVLIIWLVVKRLNLDNEEKIRQISGELRVKYPNFVNAIRAIYQTQATLHADNNKALSYKTPINTFQRHMGDMFYSIIDTSNVGNRPYIIQVYKGLDGIEIVTERYQMQTDTDLSIEEYLGIFNELAREILSDHRYLSSVSILNK